MNRTKEYKEKYEHALDRMFELFKYGRLVEAGLELECQNLKEHLGAIKSICKVGLENESINRPGLGEMLKIKNLCDDGLGSDNAHIK